MINKITYYSKSLTILFFGNNKGVLIFSAHRLGTIYKRLRTDIIIIQMSLKHWRARRLSYSINLSAAFYSGLSSFVPP